MIPNQRFFDASRGIERDQLHKIGLAGKFDTTFFWLVCDFVETHYNARSKIIGKLLSLFFLGNISYETIVTSNVIGMTQGRS